MANKPKRLIERYDILLEHLDFEYIQKCRDGQEMEKIVKVLRSGEEGYFPQLTTYAEERLAELKPSSKLFRRETPLGTRDSLTQDRWKQFCKEMENWESTMKDLQGDIGALEDVPMESLPPVRSAKVVESSAKTIECSASAKGSQRIKSCDYDAWSRYDPDTELLKMDLDEERYKEYVKQQNEKNSQKEPEEIKPDGISELPERERMILASKSKDKGNDYFRSKEYEQALVEYSNSLAIFPTAACYNNRAMTNLKLNRPDDAILDCNKCLAIEPGNVKALLRKAQALISEDKHHEAYEAYCNVLLLDRANKIAQNATDDLRKQFPDLDPPNATSMKIEEVTNEPEDPVDDDYSALIKPKNIVKDKLPGAVKALRKETAKIVQNKISEKQDRQPVDILGQARGIQRALIEEI